MSQLESWSLAYKGSGAGAGGADISAGSSFFACLMGYPPLTQLVALASVTRADHLTSQEDVGVPSTSLAADSESVSQCRSGGGSRKRAGMAAVSFSISAGDVGLSGRTFKPVGIEDPSYFNEPAVLWGPQYP